MDPYKVLGVSPSASPEEIRSAYMALVKKYHPDRYQDSDLKKQAEDKMKQINAAYDMLTKKQSGGSSYGPGSSQGYGGYSQGGSGSYSQGSYGQGSYGSYGSGYGPFGGFGSYGSYGQSGSYGRTQSAYSGSYAEEFSKVRSFLNAGRVDEADALLNAIPLKNAEWNFLYGMCRYRRGEYAKAYEYINRACTMDPNNSEYRSALDALRGAGAAGRTWTTRGSDISCCGLCASALCANMVCSLCCRGR